MKMCNCGSVTFLRSIRWFKTVPAGMASRPGSGSSSETVAPEDVGLGLLGVPDLLFLLFQAPNELRGVLGCPRRASDPPLDVADFRRHPAAGAIGFQSIQDLVDLALVQDLEEDGIQGRICGGNYILDSIDGKKIAYGNPSLKPVAHNMTFITVIIRTIAMTPPIKERKPCSSSNQKDKKSQISRKVRLGGGRPSSSFTSLSISLFSLNLSLTQCSISLLTKIPITMSPIISFLS